MTVCENVYLFYVTIYELEFPKYKIDLYFQDNIPLFLGLSYYSYRLTV